MALNASGPISLAGSTAGQSIAVELGQSATGQISLNDSAVRTLAGVPSGAIIMPTNFYGKSNAFTYTMTSNTTNGNLRTLVVAAGWNQTSAVTATINSGVYASSNSTGTAGLVISGSWPGGVTLNNAGIIHGMGGSGGGGADGGGRNGNPGSAGGLALSVSTPVSINNTGVIAGGGGGGGGGGSGSWDCVGCFGAGGGGGGRSGKTNSPGGGGGAPTYPPNPPGGTGGCGTCAAAGSGGGGYPNTGAGGPGGGRGAAGSNGGTGIFGSPYPGGSGGAGGAATSGSATYITWIATGTRNGTIG